MKRKKKTARRSATFADLREIALSMPEVEETPAYPAVLARLGKMNVAELRELLGTAWRHAMEHLPAKRTRTRG